MELIPENRACATAQSEMEQLSKMHRDEVKLKGSYGSSD